MATPADCRLIGAGDGSVMVYCSSCRQALIGMPHRGNLSDALTAWGAHTEAAHPLPDPWLDPDAAAANQPPPF